MGFLAAPASHLEGRWLRCRCRGLLSCCLLNLLRLQCWPRLSHWWAGRRGGGSGGGSGAAAQAWAGSDCKPSSRAAAPWRRPGGRPAGSWRLSPAGVLGSQSRWWPFGSPGETIPFVIRLCTAARIAACCCPVIHPCRPPCVGWSARPWPCTGVGGAVSGRRCGVVRRWRWWAPGGRPCMASAWRGSLGKPWRGRADQW